MGRFGAAYAKVLRSVSERPKTGFDLEGKFLKPGELVPMEALRTGAGWPRWPVLIECAGPVKVGPVSRRRPYRYILWRWEPEAGDWRELARAECETWDWVPVLGPVARAAILAQLPSRPPARAESIGLRVSRVLDGELRRASESDRPKVAALIYHELAARLAQLTGGAAAPPAAPDWAGHPASSWLA